MPQRVVVIWICSLCKSETDSQEKIHQYQLSMLNTRGEVGPTWTLDICATCEENDHALRSMLEAGIKESKSSKRTSAAAEGNQGVCPDCGDVFTAVGLALHRSKAHAVVSANAVKEMARGTGPLLCGAKGCDFGSTSPQGLAAHRRTVHGVVGSGKNPSKPKAIRQALGTIECTEPGCDWRGGSPQGLGVHRRYTHGIKGTVKPRKA